MRPTPIPSPPRQPTPREASLSASLLASRARTLASLKSALLYFECQSWEQVRHSVNLLANERAVHDALVSQLRNACQCGNGLVESCHVTRLDPSPCERPECLASWLHQQKET